MALAPPPVPSIHPDQAARYDAVRTTTVELCRPLTAEDMMVQSCEEASPAKWHLAHTTWFFETFLLREFLPGYQPFHPDFIWLFNSYYNAVSHQPAKQLRSVFSRPLLDEVLAYRSHVDAAMATLLASPGLPAEAERRITLGFHHEQQHSELLLYDVKNAMWSNPLRPAYQPSAALDRLSAATAAPLEWINFEGGLTDIGHTGPAFCFDNEEPRHRVYLQPFQLASRPVSCAEYAAFIDDGGYRRAELWLSEGWETLRAQGWEAPLYWHREQAGAPWSIFTLSGDRTLAALGSTPVCHISYFEADAYARWAGANLPTEAEWEHAAATLGQPAQDRDFLEGSALHPLPAAGSAPLQQMLGATWEWTASAYLGYPGYRALPGALGEYNGKFMSNQMVLRGGSVATPIFHIRSTYRNFFPPRTRWQFSGIRLARR